MNFEKRFSIPHYDLAGEKTIREFYTLIKNTSDEYRSEISDIYFGAQFMGNQLEREEKLYYGNAMGVYASEREVNDLFQVQEEYKIPISLTLNQIVHPGGLMAENQMMYQFINWLGEYYERGLRRCTLSFVHLMATGVLQKKFPEMVWKSSVFQNVDTPQQFIDLVECGYNVIQLGRNVNRNTDLLPEFKGLAEKYNVQTSMTVSDNYLPNSPFRPEHDSWQQQLQETSHTYWGAWGLISADRWSTDDTINLPRLNNNLVWMSENVLEYYFDHIDIFKYTGRTTKRGPASDMAEGKMGIVTTDWEHAIGVHDTPTINNFKMVWRYPTDDIIQHPAKVYDEGADYHAERFAAHTAKFTYAESFKEIYENKLPHYSLWSPVAWINDQFYNEKSWDNIPNTIWDSPEGKVLEHILMTCENQCYKCHACEGTFGIDQIDSLVGLNKPAESIGEEQFVAIKEWDHRTYKEKRKDEDDSIAEKNIKEARLPYEDSLRSTIEWRG